MDCWSGIILEPAEHNVLEQVVQEPVAKWQGANGAPNLLQMFYREPARYAYTFQNYVFMTRVMQASLL